MGRGAKPADAAAGNSSRIDLSRVDVPYLLRELGLAGKDEAITVEELIDLTDHHMGRQGRADPGAGTKGKGS